MSAKHFTGDVCLDCGALMTADDMGNRCNECRNEAFKEQRWMELYTSHAKTISEPVKEASVEARLVPSNQ